ncbi:hypothetical protein PR202_gb15537 [Eleusine coracana subsp. coracana]|uniref:cysteine dioxygenase n=1 Tax=Eleusine coracana subsp. coracana TaxID=191504 RepID=A0AAV5EY98_ELECO|nr:hypothetical protein PR202_gb15537 [Eleusine coracana subsp. coracana]
MHAFTAVTPCAILDVLTPPYSEDQGRPSTYFNDIPIPSLPGKRSAARPSGLHDTNGNRQWTRVRVKGPTNEQCRQRHPSADAAEDYACWCGAGSFFLDGFDDFLAGNVCADSSDSTAGKMAMDAGDGGEDKQARCPVHRRVAGALAAGLGGHWPLPHEHTGLLLLRLRGRRRFLHRGESFIVKIKEMDRRCVA